MTSQAARSATLAFLPLAVGALARALLVDHDQGHLAVLGLDRLIAIVAPAIVPPAADLEGLAGHLEGNGRAVLAVALLRPRHDAGHLGQQHPLGLARLLVLR